VYHGLVQALSPFEPPPSGSDFALVDRRVIEALLASPGARPNILTEIARMGLRRAEVPYVKEARRLGRSGWTFGKKVALLLDTLISFSHAPLRLMSYIGLGSSGLGFFYAVWIVADYVRLGNPVQGWSSLMIAVLVLGGVQLTMLGVLGEYLWRALGEARRRPPYLVQERSDDALDPRGAREELACGARALTHCGLGREARPIIIYRRSTRAHRRRRQAGPRGPCAAPGLGQPLWVYLGRGDAGGALRRDPARGRRGAAVQDFEP
jgi:hypothetical protein